ncbi:60S acidic ribosomal protein P1 [Myotis brandtii]|uniref:Large ribosomal subunit protein P2 n=1 Tax=Myotis brandtii TaxID=109478 RepID=S7MIM4_MYOBR|nr:60S acidic ribosomal protein P1 [Myotis brandtii]
MTEAKFNALIKAAGVNAEPFRPGLFAKALASVNIGSLICNGGAGGTAPSTMAAPAKKEESEESDDDMAFGLLD